MGAGRGWGRGAGGQGGRGWDRQGMGQGVREAGDGAGSAGWGEVSCDHPPWRNPTGCPWRGRNPCSSHAPGVLLPGKPERR